MTRRRQDTGVLEKPPASGIWWIDYTDAEGKRHRERIGSKDLALAMYRKRKTEIWEGAFTPKTRSKRVTFRELAEERMAAKKNRLAKRSYHADELRLEPLNKEFGSLPASSITPDRIESFLRKRRDGGISGSTANRIRSLISNIFTLAVDAGKLDVNPVARVGRYREGDPRIRFLEEDEEAVVRNAIREEWPEGESEFDLVLNTGMRRREYYELKWENVDLRRKIVTVYGKGGYRRFIPLNSSARAALEKLYAASDGSPYVCPHKKSSEQNDFRRKLEKCMKKAGIENFRAYHDLRHTFASRMVMAGVDLRSVQELLGHRSIVTTLRYAHLSPDHQKANVEKIVTEKKTPAEVVAISGELFPEAAHGGMSLGTTNDIPAKAKAAGK